MTDFSSIDKLMEFGLSMGVTTQMMRTMNLAMSQVQVPGVSCAPRQMLQQSRGKTFHLVIGEHVAGPFDELEMKQLMHNGNLTEDSLLWSAGMSNWKRAKEIPEVLKMLLLNK